MIKCPLKVAIVILPFLVVPAFAADQPTSQQQLSQAKIQIGQLLIIQGNLELEMDKLKTENDTLKAQINAAKPERKDAPHGP